MFTWDTLSNPLQARVGFVAVTKIGPPVVNIDRISAWTCGSAGTKNFFTRAT
jgi:hypothetical protein